MNIEVKPLQSELDYMRKGFKIRAIKSVHDRLKLAGLRPDLKEVKHCVEGWMNARQHMLNSFATRSYVTLTRSDGTKVGGVIASLEHEDGSGLSFNVRFEGRDESEYIHFVC